METSSSILEPFLIFEHCLCFSFLGFGKTKGVTSSGCFIQLVVVCRSSFVNQERINFGEPKLRISHLQNEEEDVLSSGSLLPSCIAVRD